MTVYRVFYDGFENYSVGDLPSTYWYTGGSNLGPAQVVTSALDAGLGPVAGSKMLRLNWDTSAPTAFCFTRAQFTFGDTDWKASDRIFIRLRFRCDADMPTNFNGLHLLRFFMDAGNDSLIGTAGDNTIVNFTAIDDASIFGGVGSTYFSTSEFLDTAAWGKFEIYWKRSATTHATWWFNSVVIDDGARRCDASGFSYTDPKFEVINLASNWSGGGSPPDDNNHIYIDEFEVFADTTWGLGGFDSATTGSMEDATIAASGGGGGGSTYAPLPRRRSAGFAGR